MNLARAASILLVCLACPPNTLSLNLPGRGKSATESSSGESRLFLDRPPPPGTKIGSGRSLYEGLPSSPGWKSGQLETLVEWAVNDQANRPVIREYDPDPVWLWTRWNGTVLKLALHPVLFNIAAAIVVDLFVHEFAESTWPLMSIPPADDATIQQLEGLNKLWGYQVTLTTFILTFFTAEAYKHWKGRCSSYSCCW